MENRKEILMKKQYSLVGVISLMILGGILYIMHINEFSVWGFAAIAIVMVYISANMVRKLLS